jgi:hypothetical protein
MKNIFFNLFSIIFLFSCIGKEEPKFRSLMQNETRSINLFASIVENVSTDILDTTVVYIKPELTDKSIIGDFSKVLVINDTIFIMDNSVSQKKIFIFDKCGNYISSIDSYGQGPQEYIRLYDFYVDMLNKEVGVLDYNKIRRYSFTGSYIGEINLKDHFIQEVLFHDNLIYTYSESQCPTNLCYAFKVFDLNGNLIFEDYPMPKDLINFPFTGSKKNNLTSDSKNVYLNSINSDTIYSVNIDRSYPYFNIDFGRHKVSDKVFSELIKKGINAWGDIRKLYDSGYVIFGLDYYLANEDYVYMRYTKGVYRSVSFYSRKSGKTFTTRIPIFWDDYNRVSFMDVVAIDNNFFYCELDTEFLWRLKEYEESEGIADPSRQGEFSSERIKRYNDLLRDLKEDDNNVIAAFRLKPF